MRTLDEQLDAVLAEKRDLEKQLTEAQALLEEALSENETLEAANKELREQAKHTAGQAAKLEADFTAALGEIETLKAEAKSAEERAADYYGAANPQPAPATPKGDPQTQPVAEQLAAIGEPAKQTAFWRGLSKEQRAELLAAQ